MMATLRNATTGRIVASKVKRAAHWWERMVGLLPKRHIGPEEGMFFDDCDAVHTVGMRAPIDIIFLDESSRVLRIVPSVPGMRFAVGCHGARAVVELGEGVSIGRDLLVGDQLALE
jgi:uncharacterized membrane protein (UPF0127 family)